MSPVRKPTSSQIVEFIRKNQTATVRELSLSLGVTPANITYHLRRLRQQSKIEPIQPRKKAGRGRSEQRFQLSTTARSNNYRILCEVLFKLIGEQEGKGEDIYNRIGELLADQFNLAPGLPAQRLNRLCAHLNLYGYQASWIAGRQGAQLIFKNCPYYELVMKIPELCRMDSAMLSGVLSSNFNQVEKIDFKEGVVGACQFIIKK